jgi:hypothetical protein
MKNWQFKHKNLNIPEKFSRKFIRLKVQISPGPIPRNTVSKNIKNFKISVMTEYQLRAARHVFEICQQIIKLLIHGLTYIYFLMDYH